MRISIKTQHFMSVDIYFSLIYAALSYTTEEKIAVRRISAQFFYNNKYF